MNHFYQKLKAWYRGVYTGYTFDEVMDLSIQRYQEPRQPLKDRFDQPLLARIIDQVWQFLSREWKWSVKIFVVVLGWVFLYLVK